MKVLFFILSIILGICSSSLYGDSQFGNPIKNATNSISLNEALLQFKKGHEKAVIVMGMVKKVCEKKGCWMTLEDQGESVRVTFKGYSFFVPQKLEGKQIIAEGSFQKKTESIKLQQHYLEDAGATKEAIDQIKSEKVTIEFVANGVKQI